MITMLIVGLWMAVEAWLAHRLRSKCLREREWSMAGLAFAVEATSWTGVVFAAASVALIGLGVG